MVHVYVGYLESQWIIKDQPVQSVTTGLKDIILLVDAAEHLASYLYRHAEKKVEGNGYLVCEKEIGV